MKWNEGMLYQISGGKATLIWWDLQEGQQSPNIRKLANPKTRNNL